MVSIFFRDSELLTENFKCVSGKTEDEACLATQLDRLSPVVLADDND